MSSPSSSNTPSPVSRRPVDHQLLDSAQARVRRNRGPGVRVTQIKISTSDGCCETIEYSAETRALARQTRDAGSDLRAATPSCSDSTPSCSELQRHFLADDERTILRVLADHAPCQAKEVYAAVVSTIGKSNFWPLWKSLQVRVLIVEDGTGFRLGPPWLLRLVSE